MTPDEAIAIVKSKADSRTRYDGQELYLDEVLVGEVERLRVELATCQALLREALSEYESGPACRQGGRHVILSESWATEAAKAAGGEG